MGKFILVTFGFMGFVFYEVSGGDDFVPLADEKRAVIAEAEAAKTVVAPIQVAAIVEPQPSEQTTAELVVASLSTQGSAQIVPAVAVQETVQQAALTIEPAPTPDMREVTSARVNMRSGPGQNFDIVSKLTAGNQVEILQDPGDGWVKLRVVDNGRVGWMADFLLTASN